MTQQDLAFKMKAGQKTISDLENAKNDNPSMLTLQECARALDITVIELLAGDAESKTDDSILGLNDFISRQDELLPPLEPRITNTEIRILKQVPASLTAEGYRQILFAIRDAVRSGQKGPLQMQIVPVDDDGKPIDEPSK